MDGWVSESSWEFLAWKTMSMSGAVIRVESLHSGGKKISFHFLDVVYITTSIVSITIKVKKGKKKVFCEKRGWGWGSRAGVGSSRSIVPGTWTILLVLRVTQRAVGPLSD